MAIKHFVIASALLVAFTAQADRHMSQIDNIDFSHVSICDSFWSPRLDDLANKTLSSTYKCNFLGADNKQ